MADAASRLPAALGERPYEVRLHTDTHLFPGLAQYDAIGAHFNVPAVLFATALRRRSRCAAWTARRTPSSATPP